MSLAKGMYIEVSLVDSIHFSRLLFWPKIIINNNNKVKNWYFQLFICIYIYIYIQEILKRNLQETSEIHTSYIFSISSKITGIQLDSTSWISSIDQISFPTLKPSPREMFVVHRHSSLPRSCATSQQLWPSWQLANVAHFTVSRESVEL